MDFKQEFIALLNERQEIEEGQQSAPLTERTILLRIVFFAAIKDLLKEKKFDFAGEDEEAVLARIEQLADRFIDGIESAPDQEQAQRLFDELCAKKEIISMPELLAEGVVAEEKQTAELRRIEGEVLSHTAMGGPIQGLVEKLSADDFDLRKELSNDYPEYKQSFELALQQRRTLEGRERPRSSIPMV